MIVLDVLNEKRVVTVEKMFIRHRRGVFYKTNGTVLNKKRYEQTNVKISENENYIAQGGYIDEKKI